MVKRVRDDHSDENSVAKVPKTKKVSFNPYIEEKEAFDMGNSKDRIAELRELVGNNQKLKGAVIGHIIRTQWFSMDSSMNVAAINRRDELSELIIKERINVQPINNDSTEDHKKRLAPHELALKGAVNAKKDIYQLLL